MKRLTIAAALAALSINILDAQPYFDKDGTPSHKGRYT